MKKVLITGANGMIGSAIVNEFIDKYDLVLVDPYTNKIDKFKDKAIILKNSLNDITEWENNLDGVNTVVHLAAAVHWQPKNKEEEQQFIDTNAEGTRKLYAACTKHGVERFLIFSTNDVYEATDKLITEDTPVNPQSIYGKSKLLAEKYLLEDSKKSDTAVCIFRPASVYGENDKGSMKSLIGLCKKGIVPMIGNGSNKKALLYRKDIVQAVKRYVDCENNLNGEVFNISSGDFGYKEMIDAICSIFEVKPFRLYIPGWFCKNIASKLGPIKKLAVAGETKIVSNEKAEKLLGYKRKYSLVEGLRDAKNYYF
ncbi:NAD-dependent epimerase/dehydratase family protein [Clostridium algidicarnis]|uniref:Nucleoside-diphosphate-sugar epimerase n=1 Tax=Clostridium algidicarnis DSM 15099 TaxID=1121295 RepID=A0A2S6FVN2_9CLOT|nr:NAD(P)-dependent oxidoreductase [Clostridium algidicarnis]PPK46366.1 nucleoside-diphosphate-sugar epimerase [Clostridium algidicarnis DSM 15099]